MSLEEYYFHTGKKPNRASIDARYLWANGHIAIGKSSIQAAKILIFLNKQLSWRRRSYDSAKRLKGSQIKPCTLEPSFWRTTRDRIFGPLNAEYALRSSQLLYSGGFHDTSVIAF
jgi:hypothetical protein